MNRQYAPKLECNHYGPTCSESYANVNPVMKCPRCLVERKVIEWVRAVTLRCLTTSCPFHERIGPIGWMAVDGRNHVEMNVGHNVQIDGVPLYKRVTVLDKLPGF